MDLNNTNEKLYNFKLQCFSSSITTSWNMLAWNMPTERLRLYLDERGIKSNANFFKLWVFFQDLSKKCSIPRTLGIHVVFLELMLLPTVLIDSFNKNYALILSRLTLAFFCFLRLFFFLLNLCLIKVKKKPCTFISLPFMFSLYANR